MLQKPFFFISIFSVFLLCLSTMFIYKLILLGLINFNPLLPCKAKLVKSFSKALIDDEQPDFQEQYFDQFIDHFNFKSFGNKTYAQRYYITGAVACGLVNFYSSFCLVCVCPL